MDLNIRPRRNEYTSLTQPRQPRGRQLRDTNSQTLDINSNINTPVIEQTPMSEPDNSNVTTSTYTAKNIRTGEEIEFKLEDKREMTRKMNISPLELDDLLDGVISSIKGWTVLVNTHTNVANDITDDITNDITHHIKETSDDGVYNEENGITNNITNTKTSIVATNLKTNITINFESVSQASQTLNIAQPSISSCINGRRQTAGGWKFSKI